MKAVKKLAGEQSSDSDQPGGDPFAVDVFAAPSSSETATLATQPGRAKSGLKQSWHSRLPRVTSSQVESSAALARLHPETYLQIQDSVISVLSRYSMNAPNQISTSLVDLQEIDFTAEFVSRNGPHGIFATFTTGSNAAAISLEIGARFAAMLVDRMLGGEGATPDRLRPLTRTERAVIEFLCLSVANELKVQSAEPLVRLLSICEQPPWWTSRISKHAHSSVLIGPEWKRGLLASLRIGAGELTGISHAYLNDGALAALDERWQRLKSARQGSSNFSYVVEELPRYSRFVRDLGLAVLIGQTEVTPAELLELEVGDVMVVEYPMLRWREQRISGSLFLLVGDGAEAWITGELLANVDAEAEAGSLKVKVGAVNTEPPPRFAGRLKMEEQAENVEAPAEGTSLIDAVMVTVRIELAARRLQLEELSRLRSNQILDLDCRATDPVDLTVDGRRIAYGELIDIEGRLGVRITKVLS